MRRTSTYRSYRKVVSNLNCHLVFVTKYRRQRLTKEDIAHLEIWSADVLEAMGAELIELGGRKGHIHLLVSYPPQLSVSQMVNSLKGVTSRRYNKQHKSEGTPLWSPSYFVCSAGGVTLDTLKTYIEEQ